MLDIENGMLVGADAYDIQQRETVMVTCRICNEQVPAYDTVEVCGDIFCEDCLHYELIEMD